MNLTHVQSFTAAMMAKDLEAMLRHMADDVVLHTPLAAEPAKGKAAVRSVVSALLGVVDSFDFLRNHARAAACFVVLRAARRRDRAGRHGLLARSTKRD